MENESKRVNLGHLSAEENLLLAKAQEKAGAASIFVTVPSLRVLVMALVRAYLDGKLEVE